MICYNCGNDVTTEGTNCPFCGSPLNPNAGNQKQFNPQYNQQYNAQPSTGSLDARTASIICYITWIGLLIAIICGDKNHPLFKNHLNNALIILISGLILSFACIIPILGWLVAIAGEIFLLVCAIMGIVAAVNNETEELPLIGQFKIIK